MSVTLENFVATEPERMKQRQADALAEYRRLVVLASLTDEEQSRLSDLLHELGKQPGDVLVDRRDLKAVAVLEGEVAKTDLAALRAAEVDARKKVDAASEKMRKANEEVALLRGAQRVAEQRSDAYDRRMVEICKLKKDRADLF